MLELEVLGSRVDVVDIGLAAAEVIWVGGPEAVGLEGVDGVGGEGDLERNVGDVAAELDGGDRGGECREDVWGHCKLHGCLFRWVVIVMESGLGWKEGVVRLL